MSTLSDLGAQRAYRALPIVLLEATVLDPPLDDDGFMRVEVDAQRGRARACPWMPRGDEEPTPGDAAWVQESDEGNLVVMVWWPQ